jgi:hypothetical protein
VVAAHLVVARQASPVGAAARKWTERLVIEAMREWEEPLERMTSGSWSPASVVTRPSGRWERAREACRRVRRDQ